MRRLSNLIILATGVAVGVAGSYWYAHRPEPISTPATAEQSPPAGVDRKILYYRNPMGAPDTSQVPKKDTMGMDYIPVYADEQDDPGTVKVSLDKIQRIGVRTEKVEARQILHSVRAVGRVEHDESLLTIVALRTDGFIEDLFVNKTGQHVSKGEPLFRVYSPQIQAAQTDLIVASRSLGKMGGLRRRKGARRGDAAPAQSWSSAEAASTKCARPGPIREPSTGRLPPTATSSKRMSSTGSASWRATNSIALPITLDVWVIADVAEADIAVNRGGHARDRDVARLTDGTAWRARSTFIYPELNAGDAHRAGAHRAAQSRSAAEDRMYADVVFQYGSDGAAVDRRSGQRDHRQRQRGRSCWSPRATVALSRAR